MALMTGFTTSAISSISVVCVCHRRRLLRLIALSIRCLGGGYILGKGLLLCWEMHKQFARRFPFFRSVPY